MKKLAALLAIVLLSSCSDDNEQVTDSIEKGIYKAVITQENIDEVYDLHIFVIGGISEVSNCEGETEVSVFSSNFTTLNCSIETIEPDVSFNVKIDFNSFSSSSEALESERNVQVDVYYNDELIDQFTQSIVPGEENETDKYYTTL